MSKKRSYIPRPTEDRAWAEICRDAKKMRASLQIYLQYYRRFGKPKDNHHFRTFVAVHEVKEDERYDSYNWR